MTALQLPRVESRPGIDRSLVQDLARQFGRVEADVERILREEIGRVGEEARIQTFVVVLATTRARIRLRDEVPAAH